VILLSHFFISHRVRDATLRLMFNGRYPTSQQRAEDSSDIDRKTIRTPRRAINSLRIDFFPAGASAESHTSSQEPDSSSSYTPGFCSDEGLLNRLYHETFIGSTLRGAIYDGVFEIKYRPFRTHVKEVVYSQRKNGSDLGLK
jgi:hypothetical protein